MRVTKQIDDTHFEVELEEKDLNSDYQAMHIAHDYVRFYSNEGLETSNGSVKLSGPAKTCENWIKAGHEVTIGIRKLIEVVLPILQKSEYVQPEHLVDPDGTPNYTWDERGFVYTDPSTNTRMIAIPNALGKGKWYHIPYQLYYKIKNNE